MDLERNKRTESDPCKMELVIVADRRLVVYPAPQKRS